MSEFEQSHEGEINVFEFAHELEKLAERYDIGYKEGDESFVRFAKSSADLYDFSSNSFSFSAERIISDTRREVILNIYKIIGETKFDNLNRISFPEDVWEALQYGETEIIDGEVVPTANWLEMLGDPDTTFAIGSDYTITATSDGVLEDMTEIFAYVNGTPVKLPDTRVEPTSLLPRAQSVISSAMEVLPSDEQADITEIFSETDIEEFKAAGRLVLKDMEVTMAVDSLYQTVESNKYATQIGVINAARNILKVLFPELRDKVE